MAKMSKLSAELDELKKCGESLIKISETLRELFLAAEEDKPKKKEAASEETPKTEIKPPSHADVRAVLADKSRNGYTSDVKALLVKYGGEKLSDISPANYEALLAEVKVIGNV